MRWCLIRHDLGRSFVEVENARYVAILEVF